MAYQWPAQRVSQQPAAALVAEVGSARAHGRRVGVDPGAVVDAAAGVGATVADPWIEPPYLLRRTED